MAVGPMVRETTRLRLRYPRLTDAPALLKIFSDVEAQRYTLHFGTLGECRRHIAVHDRHRRRTGCGPWLVTEKDGDRVIGWGGLYEDPLDRRWGIEVAYSFARSAWGRGYAGELVTYSLDVARDEVERRAQDIDTSLSTAVAVAFELTLDSIHSPDDRGVDGLVEELESLRDALAELRRRPDPA